MYSKYIQNRTPKPHAGRDFDGMRGRNSIETEEEKVDEDITISRVNITNENGEQAIGKKKGTYITIDIKNLKIASEPDIQKAATALTKELRNLVSKHAGPQDSLLVVGLGNIYVTPDSLGPKVVQDIDITRHIMEYLSLIHI